MKLKKVNYFSNSFKNPKNNFQLYQASIRGNSWVKSKELKLNLGTTYETHTIKQKLFNEPHPSRPYKRFIPTKMALTGIDPNGQLSEFISNDIIQPLSRPDLYSKTFTIDNTSDTNKFSRWALKTTARCNDIKSLPKLQPFTSYYLPPKYNNKDAEKYSKFILKTDHLCKQVPRCEKVSPDKSFIKLKSDFYSNIETKKENEWIPYECKSPINNISSQDYNIINFKPLKNMNHTSRILMHKTLYNKKKGISEIADLNKIFRVNINKDFSEKINDNPLRFRKYTGIFSDMYDSSHKNGDIIRPFGKHKK